MRLPFVPDCFEVDTSIEGNFTTSYSKHENVVSPEKCQEYCQVNNECQFFVLDLSNNDCWLKTSDVNKKITKQHVVGPKYCGTFIPNLVFRMVVNT